MKIDFGKTKNLAIFKKEKLTTAVDISDNLLRIVAVSSNRLEKSLSVLDSIALPTDKDKEIAKELHSLISKHRLGKSLILASFPRHLVTIRTLRLPATNAEEIKNMVELQAIKYLPYSREEMIIAYKIIDTTPDGYADILLIVAQRKSVDRYLAIFRNASLVIQKIALSSEGLLNWYSRLKPDFNQPVAIIDFDRYHTHIQIVKKEKILFTRSVSFDTVDPDSDRNVLLREMRLSFDSYSKEQNEEVARIVLSGRQDYAKDFSAFIADNFSIPCEQIEQLQNITAKDIAVRNLDQFKNASFTYLLGIALEAEKLTVDLLPRDIIDKKKEEALKSELTKTAVLSLLVLITAFSIMWKKLNEKNVYLTRLNTQFKAIEPEAKRLSRLKEDVELVRDQLMFKGSSIDILRELYAILPPEISLTLLEFEDKEKVLLRGTSKELSSVVNLPSVLEKSPYFGNVRINYAAERTFKEREFADFEITCALR